MSFHIDSAKKLEMISLLLSLILTADNKCALKCVHFNVCCDLAIHYFCKHTHKWTTMPNMVCFN